MIGSLTDLSRRPGMPSEVTLRKLIARHPLFPILQRGTHGRKYRIDLDAAESFVRSLTEQKRAEGAARLQLIRELGLSLSLLAGPADRDGHNG